MNLENQLLEKFQVEELEKRYEFAWISEVVITAEVPVGGNGAVIKGTITIPVPSEPPANP
jgi:hypothetical protein